MRPEETGTLANSAIAHAKINLALHVTGRRDDGYHILDTFVVFCRAGDRITVQPAPDLSLRVTGPYADTVPEGDDNLVMQAARSLAAKAGMPHAGAALHLQKSLPTAAGIGGGSADAAATLRLLSLLWSIDPDLRAVATTLGADIPMCLESRPVRAMGIGDDMLHLPDLPPVFITLVNPGIPVPTRSVFLTLNRFGAGLPAIPHSIAEFSTLVSYLRRTRNDLIAAACGIAPGIGRLIEALDQFPQCGFAGMSGSGGTCFALFDNHAAAAACAAYFSARPGWWAIATDIRSP